MMDYSCGFGPGFGGSLRRGGHIRKSLSVSSKYIGGVDYVLRTQLAEQLKCMDNKWEMDCSYLNDLLEFYKKRAVLEQEYADALNKLVQSSKQKVNTETAKRQNWPKYSYHTLFNVLLDSTIQTSIMHQVLSEVYSRQMTQRILDLQEDCTRAHKQSRELAQLCQTTVLSTTSKLTTTYRDYCSAYQMAEDSKKVMEKSKEKFDRERKRAHDKNKDIDKSQKIRKLKEDLTQKCDFNTRQNIQSLQSRNEYLIQIAAANTSVDKFFGQEIFDILNCLNLGFHNAIVRAGLNHISCEKALANSHRASAQMIEKIVQTIDPNRDQLKFLNKNQRAFNKTSNFIFQSIKDDIVTCVMSHPSLSDMFHSAVKHLMESISESKKKFEEYWKISSDTTKKLHKLIDLRDYDVEEIFSKSSLSLSKSGSRSNLDSISNRLNDAQSFLQLRSTTRNSRIELEKQYFEQFSAFIVESHHFHVLNAKLESLKNAMNDGNIAALNPKKLVRQSCNAQQFEKDTSLKIFGGCIEEYVKVSQQAIPPLISSTIHVINLYGMHNQGIFRISGSQAEINELKDLYENLQDPLMQSNQVPDVNVSAGLLKMYFRELREPVFSGVIFHDIVEAYETEREKSSFINKAADIVKCLPSEIYIVMRYLFAFLKHLTNCKEENMMDSYNLAICFGPCLMPIPVEYNKVLFHMQAIVNEIIRLFIENHDSVFNNQDIDGPLYEPENYFQPLNHAMETSIFTTNDFGEYEDAHSTLTSQRTKLSLEGSDTLEGSGASDSSGGQMDIKAMDSPPYYAIAIADFSGQTPSELSFRKNDRLVLEEFISDHWWHGRLMDGLGEGLIPLIYIQVVGNIESSFKPPGENGRSTTPIAILQVNHDIDSHYLHIDPSQITIPTPNDHPIVTLRSKSSSPIIQPPNDFSDLFVQNGSDISFPPTSRTSSIMPVRNTHIYSPTDHFSSWNPREHTLSNSMQMLTSFGYITPVQTPASDCDQYIIYNDCRPLSESSKSDLPTNQIRSPLSDRDVQSMKNEPISGLETNLSTTKNRSVSSVPAYPLSDNSSETDIDEALAKVLRGLASIHNQNKPLFRSELLMMPLDDVPGLGGDQKENKSNTRDTASVSNNSAEINKSSVQESNNSSLSSFSSNEVSGENSRAFIEQNNSTMRRKCSDAQSL